MYSKIIYLLFLVLAVLLSNVEMKKFKAKSLLKARQGVQQLQQFQQYSEPVIGILTQEVTGKLSKIAKGQYVLSSYVNVLLSAGAKVVPILINQTPQQIEQMFHHINGLLLPGGHVKLQHSKYGTVGKQLYELAKKANDRGDVFPIWAECLGLELIALLSSERGLSKGQYDTELFDYVYAKNITMPLQLSNEWKKSKLYGSAPPEMVKFMTTYLKGYHNHNKAVTMKTYKKYKKFSDMFSAISTNKDRKGKEFISTFEGKKYPFFLLHWHPTKSQLVLPDQGYITSYNQQAVWNARFLLDIFMNQARLNKHTFPDETTKMNWMINRFNTIRNDEVDGYFIPM